MIVLKEKPKSVEAEAYKTLRTNIQYSSIENSIKTILITSPDCSEGKTTVAVNLGASFAENGQSVLIIDCDLRKPSIHKTFNMSNLSGLTDVIIGKEKLENVIFNYEDNISIIPAGKQPPNPSELVGSDTMKKLLEFTKSIYDIVIIDSPPVGLVTDAQILSTQVDGTIIVVKAESTKSKKLLESTNLLKNVKAKIIGVVLNDVNSHKREYKKYYD